MALRRSCAFAVVLGLFAPGLVPLVALPSHAEQGCADHVCECARRCPPKRNAASDCHGAHAASPDCSMRGACRHDQAMGPAVATSGYLASLPLTAELAFASEPLVGVLAGQAPVGFSRIDPNPPRAV